MGGEGGEGARRERRGILNPEVRGKPQPNPSMMEEGIRILALQHGLGQDCSVFPHLSSSGSLRGPASQLPLPSFVPPPLILLPGRGTPCFFYALTCPPLPGTQVTFLSLPGYCPMPFEPGPGSLSQLLLHCTAAAGIGVRKWQAGLALHLIPVGCPAGHNCSPSSSLCFPASMGTPSNVDVLPQAGEQIGADP